MTLVIGYVPSPVGEAALKVAAGEELEHNEPLVVVNITCGLALIDRHLADSETLEQSVNALRAAGLAVTVRQGASDQDASHDMLDAVEETTPDHWSSESGVVRQRESSCWAAPP